MTEEQTIPDPGPKRGRPPGRTAKPAAQLRRNHAAELAALQGRVDTALRLLRRINGGGATGSNGSIGDTARELVAVAVETLEGTE